MYKTGALLRPQHFSEGHKCRTNGIRKPRAADGRWQGSPGPRQSQAAERWLTRDKNTRVAEPHRADPCSIEGAGRGLREMVGTARGVAPTLGGECPDTSTDRWGWAPRAQGGTAGWETLPFRGPEEPGD